MIPSSLKKKKKTTSLKSSEEISWLWKCVVGYLGPTGDSS